MTPLKPGSDGSSSSSFATPSAGPLSVRKLKTRAPSYISEVSVVSTLSMRKLDTGYRVINKYVVEKEIGRGACGEVYLCKNLDDNDKKYAMKIINRPHATWNDDANNIRQEIAVMKRLNHPNIVALHEVIDDPNARKIFLIQV